MHMSDTEKLTAQLRICVEPNCTNISNNAATSLVFASANQQQRPSPMHIILNIILHYINVTIKKTYSFTHNTSMQTVTTK